MGVWHSWVQCAKCCMTGSCCSSWHYYYCYCFPTWIPCFHGSHDMAATWNNPMWLTCRSSEGSEDKMQPWLPPPAVCSLFMDSERCLSCWVSVDLTRLTSDILFVLGVSSVVGYTQTPGSLLSSRMWLLLFPRRLLLLAVLWPHNSGGLIVIPLCVSP